MAADVPQEEAGMFSVSQYDIMASEAERRKIGKIEPEGLLTIREDGREDEFTDHIILSGLSAELAELRDTGISGGDVYSTLAGKYNPVCYVRPLEVGTDVVDLAVNYYGVLAQMRQMGDFAFASREKEEAYATAMNAIKGGERVANNTDLVRQYIYERLCDVFSLSPNWDDNITGTRLINLFALGSMAKDSLHEEGNWKGFVSHVAYVAGFIGESALDSDPSSIGHLGLGVFNEQALVNWFDFLQVPMNDVREYMTFMDRKYGTSFLQEVQFPE